MAYRRRCTNCIHTLCEVVGRQRPEGNMQFVCESIVLFEKCYGAQYTEETRELALDAILRYGPGTPFENDDKLLPIYRILGKYSRTLAATDLYDKLNEKGLFSNSPQFYFDWAEVHLNAYLIEKAMAILNLMEQAVGAQHPFCFLLRSRIQEEERRERPRTALSISSDCSAVREIPVQSARRNLYGALASVKCSECSVIPSQIDLIDEEQHPESSSESIILPISRDDSIVLPHFVEAPPIDMSIVSPSITLIQSGKIPPNFALPPVFSFAGARTSTTNSYKPSMHTTTKETTMITSSIMSTSIVPSTRPSFAAVLNTGISAPYPTHPNPIRQGEFAVPTLPPHRREISQNSENVDPRGANSNRHMGRREITGVLLPSKNFPLDPFDELEKSAEKQPDREMKKARLHKELPKKSSAVRRIFADATAKVENKGVPLEKAFQSFGINEGAATSQQ